LYWDSREQKRKLDGERVRKKGVWEREDTWSGGVTIVRLYIIALDGVRRGIDVTNGQRYSE
jgi:hypothetical protein